MELEDHGSFSGELSLDAKASAEEAYVNELACAG
jgi:hypothetical protein